MSTRNHQQIDTPALIVFPAVVQQNINAAINLAGNATRLRPHVKTHKLAEVTRMLMDAGIAKFKCATVSEAEMLAMAGAVDVLLAYQPNGVKAERLKALMHQYPQTTFSCLVDNEATVRMLSETFGKDKLRVFVDVNVGMNRTGVLPTESLEVARACSEVVNLHLMGVHAYEGHIHATDIDQRKAEAHEAFGLAVQASEAVQSIFPDATTIVIGGSPTFHLYGSGPTTEVSPGTFVFWDEGYASALPDLPFKPAAYLMTRVVSIIDEHRLCLDLGHKSVASENPFPRVMFEGKEAMELSHSEEHLVVKVPGTSIHHVGDVWYGIPHHICPTIALYEKVYAAEGEEITSTWQVQRNRVLTV